MSKENYKILIVDDEDGMRQIFKKALSLEGFYTDTIGTGHEAIKLLNHNNYNLAFIDLKLPDISGVEIIKNIDTENIFTVMITAYATVETAVNAMKFGARDYIKKPFDINDVLSIVNRQYDRNIKKGDSVLTEEKVLKKEFIFKSKQSSEIIEKIDKIKDHDIPVLITGESGTGKEMIARMIHEMGNRKNEPFITINCTAIPKESLESELFGYEKGAFPGADRNKRGRFETAGKGIVLLDEIGDISTGLQIKLLRAIEEKVFDPVGGNNSIPMNARIIATTNAELSNLIQEKKFRSDLYFRLNRIRIHLPSLRERKEDIEPLINYFLSYYKKFYNKKGVEISTEAFKCLKGYKWPGNVREMKNTIESAVLLSEDKKILVAKDFHIEKNDDEMKFQLNNIEKETILGVLIQYKFNRSLAAKSLRISRKTLYNKMKKYKLM